MRNKIYSLLPTNEMFRTSHTCLATLKVVLTHIPTRLLINATVQKYVPPSVLVTARYIQLLLLTFQLNSFK